MFSIRIATRMNSTQWRHFSRSVALAQNVATGPATPSEPLTIPPSEALEKTFSPKLEKIAADISNLNLLEVSELSQLLKKKLNLPDQPMMPMGGFVMASKGASAESEEEAAVPQKIKTEFTVKLVGFDEKQKVTLIKEVKNTLEGYNLVQAKKFVESLPAVIKADTTKEDADRLKEIFSKVGATIEIV